MEHKFESTYFKFKGAQDRCYEWSDTNSYDFFVAVDGPFKYEFSSYKDSCASLKAYDSVPEEERCFFEQIRNDKACKEYYDIDGNLASSADECEIKRLEQQVFNAFLNARNQHAPDYPLDTTHCRVLSSSKNKKISLHIVIPAYVFENNRQMGVFVLAFKYSWSSASDEDSAWHIHIDDGVYTRNRNMRILGSCKFEDTGRPLQRAQWHEPSMLAEDEEFLITNPGPDSIQVTCSTQEVMRASSTSRSLRLYRDQLIKSSMPQQLVDTMRAKFMQIPQAAQFDMHCKQDHAMIFRLDRKAEGHCIICKREHGRDNAYLSLAKSGAIFFHCRRSSNPAGVEVCLRDFALAVDIDTAMAAQTPHGLTHADIVDNARFLAHHHLVPPLEHLELGHGKLEVREQQPPSLLIRCDTGGGKTMFTEALVKANKTSRFVAITCRRTLVHMLDARLGFENYQDLKGIIACDRLVVQAESLHKVDMPYYREGTILILDEVSSLIKQMCSDKTMGKWHSLNVEVLEGLIKRATRVICLDADLSDEEVVIMKGLRSDFRVINNTFQQQKGDKVVLYESKLTLVAEAQRLLQASKRLWISSTMSAEKTEALHVCFTKAGLKGMCMTKNTLEATKRDLGKNINTIMIGLDYFIHTPTISVGIDCNVEDYVDYVIGIFSTCSGVDVETCMQMMRRVRHNKSKTYLIHADASTNNLPATAQEVKDWVRNQVDLVTGRVQVCPALKLRFDDDYKHLVMPDDLYHRIYCHVTANKHHSMNAFRSWLIQRMTQAGCVVTGKDDRLSNNHPIIAGLKEGEERIAAALHQQIAEADPIHQEEFDKLSSGSQDLSAAQRASVHQFALMRTYNIQEHSTVTQEWVKTYDNPHEKECFRNLHTLSQDCGSSLRECLQFTRQCEVLGLKYSLRTALTAGAHSKVERSQSVKLEYVVGKLVACGFKDPFDTTEYRQRISREALMGYGHDSRARCRRSALVSRYEDQDPRSARSRASSHSSTLYCMKSSVPRSEPPNRMGVGQSTASSTARASVLPMTAHSGIIQYNKLSSF